MFGVPDAVRDELDVISKALRIPRPDVARQAIAVGTQLLKQQILGALQTAGGKPSKMGTTPSWTPPEGSDPTQMSVRQTAQAFGFQEHEVYSWKDRKCPHTYVKAPYQAKAQLVFNFEEVLEWLRTTGIVD
jgi:hypothetical protein